MIFGLDLFTLGITFLFFAFVLLVLSKVVWHTFHGDIKEVFMVVIFSAIVLGLIAIGLGWWVF